MKPWEVSPDKAREIGETNHQRLEEADQIAAPLFARQLAEAGSKDSTKDDNQ